MAYLNYDDYTVIYDTGTHEFNIFYKKEQVVADARIEGFYQKGKKQMEPSDFGICKPTCRSILKTDGSSLDLVFKKEEEEDNPTVLVTFFVGNRGIGICAKDYDMQITGRFITMGERTTDCFPVSLDRSAHDVRSAIGETASPIDNAVYNSLIDMAVVVGDAGVTKIHFDRRTDDYWFSLCIAAGGEEYGSQIHVKEDVLAQKYHMKFSPINRNSTFKTPPIGWMTWYAVKFRASEETVLENARFQAEHLKDYGANTIWVDWEWYHERLVGNRDDGVNSLYPDPKKYPNGMKYVADQIRELGLIPSLWIGYTNEPCKNEYIEKYPDIVLADDLVWCGRYFYDFSNPHYLDEYLPEAIANVHKWGYEAVKFDTIPMSVKMHDIYHDNMYDPTLTTKEAYYNMIKKTRELLGEDVYMLSCSGSGNSSILWASDIFDAARIGDDIFTWEEHLVNVGRILEFYPLHNIQLHVDADNVVIREEFNDMEQAKARATIISLLGLPMTFGDEFSCLTEERVDILKRCLPILEIHPMDLTPAVFDNEKLLINLRIAKEYEEYQVTGVYNQKDKEAERTLNLKEDLHLEEGTWLVYDYFRDQFMGKVTDEISLDLVPYEGRILSLRPEKGVPQIISTSRHITQGAAEIREMDYTEDVLTISAALVENDSYTVTIYVPEGYKMAEYSGFDSCTEDQNLIRLTYLPAENGEFAFTVRFCSTEQ